MPIDTFRENVVLLSRTCVSIRPERLRGMRKVEVKADGQTILATVLISDDLSIVGPNEAGLTMPAFRRLGAPAGAMISVEPAPPASGLSAVYSKMSGETLSATHFDAAIADLAKHRWSDIEVAAFLVACASFMTADETLSLTQAMINAGTRLHWGRNLVVDKHCIGGIPGNRTSMIVVPIVAAHGLLIPKTSSRAITSPAGTADTMEVLARVDLTEDQMRATVEACGGCIVWGGRVNLSPADDVLISVERPLSLDTPEQMTASILSKKVAAGSTHLIIDIPVGDSAKIRDPRSAQRMRKLFEFVGGRLGITLEVLTTDGSQPIGRGIGPVLEASDVLSVLENRPDAPRDLMEKSIMLAGRLLEFDPAVRGGLGVERARELLVNGSARAKFEQISLQQGPSPFRATLGNLIYEITARKDGRVLSMNCHRLARIARLAGAPTDPGAGLEILKRVGDAVRAGEPIMRLYGVDPADFATARDVANEDSGIAML